MGSRKRKKSLLVVESPTKAQTLRKYLGKNFVVEASVGHIKDLPPHRLGVQIEKGFKPVYQLVRGKKEIVEKICSAAKQSEEVLIATDPDREGEAIAYHIAEEIQKRAPEAREKIKRVLFTEITKSGVQRGLEAPREIDINLVLSQQARRVLDRLIGYKISPFLWRMLPGKSEKVLSAGRVQSVALRLIVERERAIQDFEPIAYWLVFGDFALDAESEQTFRARLVKIAGKALQRPEGSARDYTEEELQKLFFIRSEEEAERIIAELREVPEFQIASIQSRKVFRNPPAPFITSSLQQEAANRLGLSSRRTMQLAQRLYEGVEIGQEGVVGLITYMRTDSPRVSAEAQQEARDVIAQKWGEEYLPETPPQYTTKVPKAQEAHEAIRPTSLRFTPEYVRPFLDPQMAALYELIYQRFIASQMKPAQLERTTVTIKGGKFEFRVTGSVVLFPGFLAVYQEVQEEGQGSDEDREEQRLPEGLTRGAEVFPKKFFAKQSQTKPPARYTEASLIRELEQKGIGRPSTYATIVSTIQERGYIRAEGRRRRLFATELGIQVSDLLVEHFPELFDVSFTAKMESQLDTIAEGATDYETVVEQIYYPMEKLLEQAEEKQVYPTLSCPECGAPMTLRQSRYGPFWGCTRYPECKGTLPLVQTAEQKEEAEVREDIRCPQCGAPMVLRNSKRGRFYGCSRYPECKGTRPYTIGVSCPVCKEGEVVERRSKSGRIFYSCSRYPECEFIAWRKPIPQPCPQCQHPWLEEKYQQQADKVIAVCPNCRAQFPDFIHNQESQNVETEKNSRR